MRIEWLFLDYVWKALFLGTATASFFGVFIILSSLMSKKSDPGRARKYFLWQISAGLGLFVGGFFAVAFVDQELSKSCFDNFVQLQGAITITRMAAGLWILVVAGLAAFEISRFRKSLRRIKNLPEIQTGPVTEILLEVRSSIGYRKKISIFWDDRATSPYVYGFSNPKIVLPVSLQGCQPAAYLRGIVAHEMSHVKAHDPLWSLVEIIFRRLLFFHPVVYFTKTIFYRWIETCADESAIRTAQIKPADYVVALLKTIEQNSSLNVFPSLGLSRNFLETRARIQSIIERSKNPKSSSRNYIFVIGAVSALGMTLAHAQTVLIPKTGQSSNTLVCRQIEHERAIDSWLNIKTPINRCE